MLGAPPPPDPGQRTTARRVPVGCRGVGLPPYSPPRLFGTAALVALLSQSPKSKWDKAAGVSRPHPGLTPQVTTSHTAAHDSGSSRMYQAHQQSRTAALVASISLPWTVGFVHARTSRTGGYGTPNSRPSPHTKGSLIPPPNPGQQTAARRVLVGCRGVGHLGLPLYSPPRLFG